MPARAWRILSRPCNSVWRQESRIVARLGWAELALGLCFPHIWARCKRMDIPCCRFLVTVRNALHAAAAIRERASVCCSTLPRWHSRYLLPAHVRLICSWLVPAGLYRCKD